MKSRSSIYFAVVALFATLAYPIALVAGNNQNPKHNKHHHYKLVDAGTFGGPASYFFGSAGSLSSQGIAAGSADISAADPFPAFCFDPDCYVAHAFKLRDGHATDLGTLADGWSSQASWISESGNISGVAQNGEIDPLIGIPEFRGVLWRHGRMTDLGTLEGGYETVAISVNNRGNVAGFALNTVSDPYCLFAPGLCNTQTRAFLWRHGTMQDLGTLGGPDAGGFFLNEHDQVAGYSYINSTPNSVTDACGTNVPTADPFLWDPHHGMTDLGTLGGTCGTPVAINNQGQVTGQSDLAGDLTFHPFLWDGRQLRDLGTFGGNNGQASWINDAGDVVGKADLPGSQTHDAFLWKNGVMRDLGTLEGDSCSNAYSLNSRGQVVGTSEDQTLCNIPTGEHAFLWEHGTMVDLNSLIPPNSSLELTFALAINDDGEIAGTALPSGCTPDQIDFCGHAFVLIPCDEHHPGVEGCDYNLTDVRDSGRVSPVPRTPHPAALTPRSVRMGMLNRFRFSGSERNPVSGAGPATGQEQQASPKILNNDLLGDNRLSPDCWPPLRCQHRGACDVDSSGRLTGYCRGRIPPYWTCGLGPSKQCPKGKKALKPTYVQCGEGPPSLIDEDRPCTF
jgi:probable HAF family extracellular repeat protein